MKRVGFRTLGCKVNQYETEAMREKFEKNGYRVVDVDEPADVYVINTCTVTNISDRKSRQFIRRAKRNNDEAVVVVVGCYSQVYPEELEVIEEVDVIIGTSQRNRVVELAEKAIKEKSKINIVQNTKEYEEFEEIKIEDLEDKTRAYIKIQDGCNQYCSYCIIPYARGPIRSRKIEDVVKEVKRLSESGFKEIVLTGIHVSSYGKDFNDGTGLKDLVLKISEVKGIERIRFSSLEPRLIDDDFMEILVKSKKVCDHFHLSLQSGSDSVLKRMNRKYDIDKFKSIVKTIRSYMPEAGITTDIIVGFPGETEEEFKETCKLVEEIGFSQIHVFKYSEREGTIAAKMKNQVDGNIKNERSAKLIELAEEETKKFISKNIGKEVKVLFEEEKINDKYMEGYTSNYIRVRVKYNEEYIGEVLPVYIKSGDEKVLIGEIIN